MSRSNYLNIFSFDVRNILGRKDFFKLNSLSNLARSLELTYWPVGFLISPSII